jgi:hypothetical protein
MKFLGFLIFAIIFLMGFSMLFFLGGFVGYWLSLLAIEKVNPKLAYRIVGYKPEEEEDH